MGGRTGPRTAVTACGVPVKCVKVDPELCQGHNRCFDEAPELFELDEYGYAHEIGEGLVPPELEEKAELAVINCPERAITLNEVENPPQN